MFDGRPKTAPERLRRCTMNAQTLIANCLPAHMKKAIAQQQLKQLCNNCTRLATAVRHWDGGTLGREGRGDGGFTPTREEVVVEAALLTCRRRGWWRGQQAIPRARRQRVIRLAVATWASRWQAAYEGTVPAQHQPFPHGLLAVREFRALPQATMRQGGR